MQTQWNEWLAAERAAGRGGVIWPDPIVRGLPFRFVLNIPADVSGDTFKAALRAAPDAAGAVLAAFTVTVGSFASGLTPVTFDLSESAVDALPADGAGEGLTELVGDILHLPASGIPVRMAAFVFPISGKVTDDE